MSRNARVVVSHAAPLDDDAAIASLLLNEPLEDVRRIAGRTSASQRLDFGYAAVLQRLGEQADEIRSLTCRLSAAKLRRDVLVFKLVRGGLSERVIAAKAGVSGPRVQQLKRQESERWKRYNDSTRS